MENMNAIIEGENQEQNGLSLKLAYMVEDFVELVKRKEQEELVGEESS